MIHRSSRAYPNDLEAKRSQPSTLQAKLSLAELFTSFDLQVKPSDLQANPSPAKRHTSPSRQSSVLH